MYTYILLFIIPWFFSSLNKDNILHKSNVFLVIYLLTLVSFLGFRYEFGTDWSEYSKDYFQTISNYKEVGFFEAIGLNNLLNFELLGLIGGLPLYNLTFILSYHISDNIIFFNFLNSFIAVFGIYYYFKILNLKNQILWPLICFIFPFFIFISTDIIRQFTSLIFILISLAYFQNSKFYRSIIFLVIASFFHISSLIFFGLFLLNKSKFRVVIVISFIFIFVHSYLLKTNNFLIELIYFYLSADRLGTYSINFNYFLFLYPFFLVTILYYLKIFNKTEKKIISFFIVYGLLCFCFALLDDTVSYRLSVYLLIFYIFIISIYLKNFNMKKLFWFKQSLVYFSAAMIFIWLNFSEHKHVYLPYKSVLSVEKNFHETKTQICAKYPHLCMFKQQ